MKSLLRRNPTKGLWCAKLLVKIAAVCIRKIELYQIFFSVELTAVYMNIQAISFPFMVNISSCCFLCLHTYS